MKKNMRSEIIVVARQLFDEYGYNGVSMRMVAGALNISVGNLTYHFNKKEDLMEAVVLEQHKGYQKAAPPVTLFEMDDFFRRAICHRQKNPYYFRHYEQLAQLCPNIHNIQLSVIADKYAIVKQGICNLEDAGLFLPEQYPGQTTSLIQSIMTICTFGITHFEKVKSNDIENKVIACIWSILFPRLSEEGKKIYLQQIKK